MYYFVIQHINMQDFYSSHQILEQCQVILKTSSTVLQTSPSQLFMYICVIQRNLTAEAIPQLFLTVYIFLANSKNPLSPIFYFLFLSFGEIQKDPQLLEITFSNTSAFSPHPFYHE